MLLSRGVLRISALYLREGPAGWELGENNQLPIRSFSLHHAILLESAKAENHKTPFKNITSIRLME